MIVCIIFERELEGKEIIHENLEKLPTTEEAIEIIESKGYIFKKGYDEVKQVFEVKQ